MHSRARAFLAQPPYRGKLMRKWLTRPSLHTPTATPSDICSYYAKLALSQSLSCVVCLLVIFEFAAPISVRRCKLHFPRYRLVQVSWKSAQPFPRTVVWYFVVNGKKQKKTPVKHIRIRLIGGCVNDWLALANRSARQLRRSVAATIAPETLHYAVSWRRLSVHTFYESQCED